MNTKPNRNENNLIFETHIKHLKEYLSFGDGEQRDFMPGLADFVQVIDDPNALADAILNAQQTTDNPQLLSKDIQRLGEKYPEQVKNAFNIIRAKKQMGDV